VSERESENENESESESESAEGDRETPSFSSRGIRGTRPTCAPPRYRWGPL